MWYDIDKELEKRGLRFARYADDCNIYVKSEKARQRVMQSVIKFLKTELKTESEWAKERGSPTMGSPNFWGLLSQVERGTWENCSARKPRETTERQITGLTRKMRGNKMTDSIRKFIMPITRGWANYFSIAEARSVFAHLDGWIRRKITGILWRQWKKNRTRCKQSKGYIPMMTLVCGRS